MEKYCKFYLSFLAILLLNFAFPVQAWAGHGGTHTSKAIVVCSPLGAGSVYISTSPTQGDKQEVSWQCNGENDSSHKSKIVYLFASSSNEDAYQFQKWEGNNETKSDFNTSVTAPWVTDGTTTYTAYFVKKFYFAVIADVDKTNSTGDGNVSVSFVEEPTPTLQDGRFIGSAWGTSSADSETKTEVTFRATPAANMNFKGWFNEIGEKVSGDLSYTTELTSDKNATDNLPTLCSLHARFSDPSKKSTPVISLESGETDITLYVDDDEKVVFSNVDETLLIASELYSPTINSTSHVDADESKQVVRFDYSDPKSPKIIGNRAGDATITFHHRGTDEYNEENFIFKIHVEKITPIVSWKTSTLFIQEYGLEDLIETPSDGAWSITSNDESVFASWSSDGTTSTTPSSTGSVTLTFSQSASYKYNAISAQSQELTVYDASALATFSVNNVAYNTLAEAITASIAGGKKYTILVTGDGMVIPGTYTIPSGVTLLVPYDDAGTVSTTTCATSDDKTTPSLFRKLTLPAGTTLNIEGALCVNSAGIANNGGGQMVKMHGAYGQIIMEQGSEINIESGANLYVWGFITGSGNVNVKSGANIYEALQFDLRGAKHILAVNGKVLPLNQYYVQNVEAPLTIFSGASETLFTVAKGVRKSLDFIKTDNGQNQNALFLLKSGSKITRVYECATDRMRYDLYGNTILSNISITIATYGCDSKNSVLPITNNMTIGAHSGTTTIKYAIELLPDTRLEIDDDAVIDAYGDIFVYDKEEWIGKKCALSADLDPVPYAPGRTYTNASTSSRSAKNMNDASVLVNGTLKMNKNACFYTTTGMANVYSVGAGKIILASGAGSKTKTLQNVGTAQTTQEIPVTPAQLRNADDSFTPTAGAPAGATFTYINGMWVRPEEICAEVYIGANGDNYITYQGNWVKVTCDGSTCDCTDESGNKYKYNDPEWVKVFDLKWDANGGTFGTYGETIIETLEEGATITAPANPTHEGYTFAGWDKEIPATMPAENITITAQWTEVPTTAKYTVKHYKLHIKDKQKFAEPFKTDESEEEIGSEVTPEFEVIKGYDPPAEYKTITISANPEENVVVYEYPISETNKLEVEDDTKNIKDSTEAYTVILAPGKTMNITGKGSVTAQNLVLQSVPGDNTGANLATTSGLDILGKVCIEINMNKSGTMDDKLYYCFSVPFNVNVADGVKRLNETNGNWESAVLNTNYRVYTYSESDRATKGPQDSNWEVFSGTQFFPGVFYLCAFDNSNYNRYRFYAADKDLDNKENIAVSNSKTESKNGGWNGVANNGLTDNQLSGDFTYIQTLNSEYNCFEAAEASEKPLAIGNAAMVQVSASGSVVVGETSSAVAARRMGEMASTEFINVRLYKENQDQHVDQIFIRASEDASEQYVAGIDLSKATMGTPKVARLWVNDYNLQLVANEALMTNDQATFSLGMSAPANGEYTIALNEVPNDATIYLTENGSAIWNLNIAPAPISLSKGTENSYGLRLVHKINNVVTGFDEAVLNGGVQKVILNDHMYIIRDGKVYSAHGHVIK